MRDINRFRGCLIGGAAGDALGYAVEFLREEQIFSKYGENGITEYSLRNGKAEISDDTQMTLFTANGLLLGTTRGMTRGIMGNYESYIQIMYKCWYRTQTESYPINEDYLYSWLLNIPEFFSRRAPGMTCLSAIEHGAAGSTHEPINNSKGCGGVMRVAPIGLYFCDKSISYEKSDICFAFGNNACIESIVSLTASLIVAPFSTMRLMICTNAAAGIYPRSCPCVNAADSAPIISDFS